MATRKGLRIDFLKEGTVVGSTAALCAAPVVTDNAVNHFSWGGKGLLFTNTGQNDDVSPTKHASLGWVIPNDNTDDDGIEINTGIEATSNPCAFVIGTDPAFYLKVTFNIPDVSDYDIAAVGFRKVAAQADVVDVGGYTNYTDYAYISATAGDYNIYTGNDGTDVVTDITNSAWLDTESHTLTVKVSSAGVVTCFIDDVASAGEVAFSFDSGDTVTPSVLFAKAGTASDTPPVLALFECGYQ
jgi:hypothetical protein